MNFEATVLKQLTLMSRLIAMPPTELLTVFLMLVAAHSFTVGILLVIQPPVLMALMGFGVIEQPFFPCQGGVFHVIMAIAYVYGAFDVRKNRNMIIYAIIVKMAAVGFLFSYFYSIERLMVVFLSGVVDLGMGVIIWGLLVRITNDE